MKYWRVNLECGSFIPQNRKVFGYKSRHEALIFKKNLIQQMGRGEGGGGRRRRVKRGNCASLLAPSSTTDRVSCNEGGGGYHLYGRILQKV